MRPPCSSRQFEYGLMDKLDVAGVPRKTEGSAARQGVQACHGTTPAAAGGFVVLESILRNMGSIDLREHGSGTWVGLGRRASSAARPSASTKARAG